MARKQVFNKLARKLGQQLVAKMGAFNSELFAVQLIEKNADLTVKDKAGNTPLMLAAATRKVLAVEAMLRLDVALAPVNTDGMNALGLAILDGNKKIADMLTERGAVLTATQIVAIATAQNIGDKTISLLRDVAAKQDLSATKKAAAQLKK